MTSPVERIRQFHPELTALRRDLHAHPELAFQESRTATLVAERLKGWGIEVHTGLARTGVVGVIPGRRQGTPPCCSARRATSPRHAPSTARPI